MLFSISSILMFQSCKLQSIKIGFAFCLITAKALEIIVKLGIKISSFFLIPRALTAISKAAVPLETATEYLLCIKWEKFFSNFFYNEIALSDKSGKANYNYNRFFESSGSSLSPIVKND